MVDKKIKKDWVDRIADIAAMVGFNRVRVRWRLDRFRRRMADSAVQTKGKVSHVGYANKVCPRCHSVNDAYARICARCEEPLGSRAFQILFRIGILTPHLANVSTVIGVAMVAIYARMMVGSGAGFASIVSMDSATLFKFGGSFAGAYHEGEWCRLLTCVFLHAGLWHLGFNLFALSQIGPLVEDIYGRARMMFYFVLTGAFASLGSLFIRAAMAKMTGAFADPSIAIGASGAIMGLMGIMTGWGFRDGTETGRNAKIMALKWAAYTIVFGFIIGADNGAHVAGFLLGGFIGLAVNPKRIRNHAHSHTLAILAVVSTLLIVGVTVACLIPMPSPLAAPFEKHVREFRHPEQADQTLKAVTNPHAAICDPWRAGDQGTAKRQFLVTWSPHILMSNVEIDSLIRSLCVIPPTPAPP